MFERFTEPARGVVLPTLDDVRRALEWSVGSTDLVVACHAGRRRSAALAYLIGVVIGLVAGYSRSLVDPALMRSMDVLLALMSWGDRWVSEDGAPMELRHKTCGHKSKAQVTCSSCGEPISAHQVRIYPGPGARQGWGTPWEKLPSTRSKQTA